MSRLRFEGRKELTIEENERLNALSDPLLSLDEDSLAEWLEVNIANLDDSKMLFKRLIKIIASTAKHRGV